MTDQATSITVEARPQCSVARAWIAYTDLASITQWTFAVLHGPCPREEDALRVSGVILNNHKARAESAA